MGESNKLVGNPTDKSEGHQRAPGKAPRGLRAAWICLEEEVLTSLTRGTGDQPPPSATWAAGSSQGWRLRMRASPTGLNDSAHGIAPLTTKVRRTPGALISMYEDGQEEPLS